MAARWLLLHPARVRGGAGAGDAILGVSSLGWGCTVAPSGSAQPQEESHSQRQGEGEEGWAAAEGAHVACGGVWSGGGDSCDHSPLVRLAKGLEKKTRKSGIAPNRSGQQHGVEPPPPQDPSTQLPWGQKGARVTPMPMVPLPRQGTWPPLPRQVLLRTTHRNHCWLQGFPTSLRGPVSSQGLLEIGEGGAEAGGWSLPLRWLRGSGWGCGGPRDVGCRSRAGEHPRWKPG